MTIGDMYKKEAEPKYYYEGVELVTGELNGTTKGSSARFNNGKIPYEVLPIDLLLTWLDENKEIMLEHSEDDLLRILVNLGQWQNGDDEALNIAIELAMPEYSLWGFADAARVFDHVTKRPVKPYPLWNWQRGMPWMVPLGCALRHIEKEMVGIELDEETNLPHRGHLLCNLIMLLQYSKTYTEGDNRPPKEFL